MHTPALHFSEVLLPLILAFSTVEHPPIGCSPRPIPVVLQLAPTTTSVEFSRSISTRGLTFLALFVTHTLPSLRPDFPGLTQPELLQLLLPMPLARVAPPPHAFVGRVVAHRSNSDAFSALLAMRSRHLFSRSLHTTSLTIFGNPKFASSAPRLIQNEKVFCRILSVL